MTRLRRRAFLVAGSAVAATPSLTLAAPVSEPDRTVHLVSDGIRMTPAEHTSILARLASQREVGVDDYSNGGITQELEQRMAKILGKEAAVFFPTGTLANHLGVRLLANGQRVLVQRESHLYCDEGDCAQRLSNINLIPLAHGRAAFTLAEVEEEVERGAGGRVTVPVGAISIESPVRRKAGEVFPFDEMKRIAAYARSKGIALHLDGSRLFLASPYTGVSVAQYAALFDTVYVSTYKYFNASFGAILAGPAKLLDGLYHTRRMFGCGLPHVWPQALMALHYLDGFEQRFATAVSNANTLFQRLEREGMTVRRVPNGTNIATISMKAADAPGLQKRLASAGVLAGAPKPVDNNRLELMVQTNETLARRSAADVAQAFLSAVRA